MWRDTTSGVGWVSEWVGCETFGFPSSMPAVLPRWVVLDFWVGHGRAAGRFRNEQSLGVWGVDRERQPQKLGEVYWIGI